MARKKIAAKRIYRKPRRALTQSWHEEGPLPLITRPSMTPLPARPPDGTGIEPPWLTRLARFVAKWLVRGSR